MHGTAGRTTLGVITFAALATTLLTLGGSVPATGDCVLNCSGNGICLNSSCSCNPCYNGAGCETECSNNGVCLNSSFCACDSGFSGVLCQFGSTSTSSSSSTATTATTSTTSTTLVTTYIGVIPKKLIILDKPSANREKIVFVSKDLTAGITKGVGTDPAQISAQFEVRYASDATAGTVDLPAGAHNGTDGWRANNANVAKYVNSAAPSGPTSAKVGVIKPDKLVKLSAKGLGSPSIDIVGAGAPGGSVYTAYCVTNGGDDYCHCSDLTGCTYTPLTGGGAKLVCRVGVADPTCQAIAPPPAPTCPGGGAPPPAVCADASDFCAALPEPCRPCLLAGSGNSSLNLAQCVTAVCGGTCLNSSLNTACTAAIVTAGCEADCCGP